MNSLGLSWTIERCEAVMRHIVLQIPNRLGIRYLTQNLRLWARLGAELVMPMGAPSIL